MAVAEKQKYWITDTEGVKAVVEGAEARNWWTQVHGWSLTDLPAPEDRVWLQHNEHGGRQIFPAAAAPGWASRGWFPSDPPVPVDKATAHWTLEPEATAPQTPVSTKPAADATSGKNKE